MSDWKSCCQKKLKVFFLLLLHYRLNTRVILPRKTFSYLTTRVFYVEQAHLKPEITFSSTANLPMNAGNISAATTLGFLITFKPSSLTYLDACSDCIFKGVLPNLYGCQKKFKDEPAMVMRLSIEQKERNFTISVPELPAPLNLLSLLSLSTYVTCFTEIHKYTQ